MSEWSVGDMTCAFRLHDALLAAAYTVLGILALGSLAAVPSTRHLSQTSLNHHQTTCWAAIRRQGFKSAFLMCVLLLSSVRSVFFFQLVYSPHCDQLRGIIHMSSLSQQISSTFPSAVFISGFSAFLYNLSSIYHLSLNAGLPIHESYFVTIWAVLILMNIGVYLSILISYICWSASTDTPFQRIVDESCAWIMGLTLFLEGLLGAVYGYCLYTQFTSAYTRWRENPMKNIAIVTSICLSTYSTRAALIAVYTDKQLAVGWSAMYYAFTELLPVFSIVFSFLIRTLPQRISAEEAPLID